MTRNVQVESSSGRWVEKWIPDNDTLPLNSVREPSKGFELEDNLPRFVMESHLLNNSVKNKLRSEYNIGKEDS